MYEPVKAKTIEPESTDLTAVNNTIQAQRIDSNLFEEFLTYLDVASDYTKKGYKTCIRNFAKWLIENNITQPKREDILAYKKHLEEKGYTAGTQRQYLRAVKQFFCWCADSEPPLYKNIARNIKVAKVKMDNSRKDCFTEIDIKNILDSIDISTEKGIRDYCMILLATTCSLRIIELQRANIGDIEEINGITRLYIQGKGHSEKDDYKKVIEPVKEKLDMYLSYRDNPKPEEPLFTSTGRHANNDKRLLEPCISRIIKERFINAGYNSKRLTAHSLRHTSNTLLFKSGADLYTVQQHARHLDPKTTEIYIHALDKENAQNEQAVYNQIFNSEPVKENSLGLNDIEKQIAELQSLKADILAQQ